MARTTRTGVMRTTRTGKDGRFAMPGLPVGRCVVRWLSLRDMRSYDPDRVTSELAINMFIEPEVGHTPISAILGLAMRGASCCFTTCGPWRR